MAKEKYPKLKAIKRAIGVIMILIIPLGILIGFILIALNDLKVFLGMIGIMVIIGGFIYGWLEIATKLID